MVLDELTGKIEAPFGGHLSGVSVLVCGLPDDGRLAIRLARHSAKVVALTDSAEVYSRVEKEMPQALDMLLIHTDITRWISANNDHKFDIIVSFDSYLSIKLMLEDCGELVKLRYDGEEYKMN